MKLSSYTLMLLLAFAKMPGNADASTAFGNISCKQWLDRQNKSADGDAYTVWLDGYMRGANAEYGDMLDSYFIKNSDKISIADWTDVYCRKYPDS